MYFEILFIFFCHYLVYVKCEEYYNNEEIDENNIDYIDGSGTNQGTSTNKFLLNLSKDVMERILSRQILSYQDKKNECLLPRKIGNIHLRKRLEYTKKWYYNHNFRKCIEFFYTGYNGNTNNFKTCYDCLNRCFMSFKPIRYKSKNPFNKQGLYFMNLMKNNSKSDKTINHKSISMLKFSNGNENLDNNETKLIDSINYLKKTYCISLN